MASIVKVPKNNVDYDFIAFSFNGLHSYEDFGIYRTSDGDGYKTDMGVQKEEKVVELPGRDGQFYFGRDLKTNTFQISFAFDSLTETKLQEMKQWLGDKQIHDLWFAEAPYKVYSARAQGVSTIKSIAFFENGERVYKGTGSVQFICSYPYAHTPSKVQKLDSGNWVDVGDGRLKGSYSNFLNHEEFDGVLPEELPEGLTGHIKGELPAYFVLNKEGSMANISKTYTITQGTVVHSITITLPDSELTSYTDFQWDSRTGIVSAVKNEVRVPIPYAGNSICMLEPGEITSTENISELQYDFWYY